MSTYQGLLIRNNLSDTGAIPRTGAWTGCPDIIPWGNAHANDAQTKFGTSTGTTTSYDKDPGTGITTNNVNYIYLRAKNLTPTDCTGIAYLFYVPSNICLWPDQWTQDEYRIPGVDKQYAVSLPAGANQIGVTPNPFQWMNPLAPPDGNHYCLVSMVGTSMDAIAAIFKAAQDVSDMASLGLWIYNNGGAGWRNVVTTDTGAADFSTATKWTNKGPEGNVDFRIYCENVPAGSYVAFDAPVSTGSGEGYLPITLPKSQVPIPKDGKAGDIVKNWNSGIMTKVPQGYTSPFNYQWYSNGFPKSHGFKLTIQAVHTSEGNDALVNHPVTFAQLVGKDAYHYHPKFGLVQGMKAFTGDDPFGPPDVPDLGAVVIGSHATIVQ